MVCRNWPLLSALFSPSLALMDEGYDKVRDVIGDERVSGLSEKDIKDTLWYHYFDAEETIQWALGSSHSHLRHVSIKASSRTGKTSHC
jgi:hypothetical protein